MGILVIFLATVMDGVIYVCAESSMRSDCDPKYFNPGPILSALLGIRDSLLRLRLRFLFYYCELR